jgi:parallel beta-helix repeat protein
MQTNVIPADGMIIREDTRFVPGVYVLPNGISIEADGVTVEGEGVLIICPTMTGVGVRAQGRKGVTVRGLRLYGFYHGIRCDDCADVTIENVEVRGTYEIEGIDTFLYLWLPIEQVYGGAILLNNVRGGTVRQCDLQHQMIGVLLYGCANMTVERNNASFNSGWGVYLSGTNDSTISDNQLDFCNRVYRRPENGSIRVEADAAAIVLVRASSRNRFLRNSCLCGGDGIFVAGYEHPGKVESCSDNLFEENDCRLSPNNAIESTFSQGNIFRRNDCSRSNYGFWMGYSWDNVIEDNEVEFNRWVGIAAEHAHNFVIRNNRIKQNGEGVRLWTRGGEVVQYYPGFEVSYDMMLENNQFESNRIGFNGYTGKDAGQPCHDFTFERNTFKDNRVGAQFDGILGNKVVNNQFIGNIEAGIHVLNQADVKVEGNTFEGNGKDQD